MNRRIFISLLVIFMAIAAMGGATLAWFTDAAEIETNTFEAGTVTIETGDVFVEGGTLENWNPGDCDPKLITIEYTGSKRAFLRMQLTETWTGATGNELINGTWDERDAPQVDWKVLDTDGVTWVDWNPDGNWKYHVDWWYFDGTDATTTLTVGTYTIKAVDDSFNGNPITIVAQVCLDGPTTGNDYQGATYTVDAKFQAIQASHSGEWDWDTVDFDG